VSNRIQKIIFTSAVIAGAAFSACGGCDEQAAGAADGASCTADKDCLGVCGGDGVCEGGNNANAATNAATNATTNAATNVATNTSTGTGTGGDGTMCTTDAECSGFCNSDGVCVGGGLPDGEMCQADTECGQTLCNGEPCLCDNGIDDDGDGLIDGNDPECTGPYDDDEETFATGIPGDNKDPKWQDCFFDGNSGAGDDGCRYHTDCLTGDLPMDDPDCSISQECFDYCRPRTPNGCDCFGCCGVDVAGSVEYIQIGADCSISDIDTCSSCVQTDECLNECGECEICLGKTEADLPASCSTGGGFTGDPCTADSDCMGVCGGTATCEGYGGGGYSGDTCMSDLDCRGICGGTNTCEGFGGGTGGEGDTCSFDSDCVGTCGLDNMRCSGAGGYVGEGCTADADCQGTCGGTLTCEGYGGAGYNDDGCTTDADCRGTCGGSLTCEGSGSATGSGIQCDGGEVACPGGQSDCPAATGTVSYYCQQGCCLVISG
jgi:hypothetical protein